MSSSISITIATTMFLLLVLLLKYCSYLFYFAVTIATIIVFFGGWVEGVGVNGWGRGGRGVAHCGALGLLGTLRRTVAHCGAAWRTAAHCVAHCGALWRTIVRHTVYCGAVWRSLVAQWRTSAHHCGALWRTWRCVALWWRFVALCGALWRTVAH